MITTESNRLGVDEFDYELHMRHALQLAENALTATPNPRVGCVIVAAGTDNEVVAEGWHQRAGADHAEVNALSMAGQRARDSTVFVSLEPCAHFGRTPPCTRALIDARVKRVVIAALDPYPEVAGKGVLQLEQAGIEVIQLTDFEQRAIAINAGYFKRLTEGRPFVRCKLAMSLDGRTAAANGDSKWITGPQARGDVQRLRAGSCAIVTGVDTVLADDPSLTVRPGEVRLENARLERNRAALDRQPLRVIMDTRLRTPTAAKMLKLPGRTRIFSNVAAPRDYPGDTEVISLDNGGDELCRVAPAAVLESLAANFAVNEVLLEAGPTLSGAFVAAGLVDELVLYVAAKLMGSKGRPLMELPHIEALSEHVGMSIDSITKLGNDCRIVATFDHG